MPASTTSVVVQDVPVDGGTEAGAGRTASRATHDAVDDYASRRAEQSPGGAAQKADLCSGHSCSDTARRADDGADGTTETPCQVA